MIFEEEEMDDKDEYFRQLYALNDSSDEEEDTNNAREILKQSSRPPSSSFSVSSHSFSARRSQPSKTLGNISAIHRTTSAPASSTSVVRETPLLTRKSSKLRYDISTPEMNQTFSASTPPTLSSIPAPAPQRSVSTSELDTGPKLNMVPSAGINAMLSKPDERKKRKRKETPVILVPERERIFAGKTIFFIPPNDKHSVREARITNAMKYGATWTKKWTPDITHIIVDKEYKFEQIMGMLKPLMKTDSIPQNIILVNDKYTVDCIRDKILVDETQSRYIIRRDVPVTEEQEIRQPAEPRKALRIQRRKSKKDQDTPDDHTQRSEASTQSQHPQDQPDSSPGVWLPTTNAEPPVIVESPRERSPMLDVALGEGSELDTAIAEIMRFGDLPLDDDDDEEERPSSSEGNTDPDHDGSSEEDLRPRRRTKKRKKFQKQGDANSAAYVCMTGGTGITDETNPNRHTIQILEKMSKYYGRMSDTWRELSYRKACGTLRKQGVWICTFDQAFELPFIGERIATKIEEIAITGHLRRLDNAELEPEDHLLKLFLGIYNVGPVEASKFIRAGYKTLDDLRTKARLTKCQQIGLDHYDDFATRIPRDQMTALGEIVKAMAKPIDPDVNPIIGGSYRRGAKDSGDIDFIFTKPGTTHAHDLHYFLSSLVSRLTSTGFLTCALATPSHRRDDDSGSKWHGACVLPGNPIWRRIDFLLVPESEIGAALIYFTGDDIFNRSMRLLASRKNMRLNQRGLYKDLMRGPGRLKLNEGELVEGSDEKRIFEILGVPWKKPENRICH
ncbi:related to DNA-directed DNA polymerase lambda [Phialocephala subalpina]|uniref:DNA polymerase lambda n=1 Tax=Phialocephala subalpina TaxID=576137 RepID=A0A1L7X7H0_9HELO|nr:related to DNA-directed DNA polymerase lambda [Phialocephala subalpina]